MTAPIADARRGGIDYLGHLSRDSGRFLEVLAHADPGARVPTCPDWDADDLLWHLAEVQWFWGAIVGRGLTGDEDAGDLHSTGKPGRPGGREGLLAFFTQASADLHDALSSTAPATPAWTWWPVDQTVGFIRRRQAHEALIHRVDAELTAGDRTTMDADLSTDGVDEALSIMYGGLPPWAHFAPETAQTIRVETTDTHRSWLATLGRLTGTDPEGTSYEDPGLTVASSEDSASGIAKPAATVRGAAADLDCWLWRRPPLGLVDRSGDQLVLERLDQTIAEGIS